jgi:hypothetical protein
MSRTVPTAQGSVPTTHNKPPKKMKKVADNIYLCLDLVRGKKRELPYRVHIHYKGEHYVKMCETLEEAKIWRDEKWRLLRMPKEYQEIEKLKNCTVSAMVYGYVEEVSKPKRRDNEVLVLVRFADLPASYKTNKTLTTMCLND